MEHLEGYLEKSYQELQQLVEKMDDPAKQKAQAYARHLEDLVQKVRALPRMEAAEPDALIHKIRMIEQINSSLVDLAEEKNLVFQQVSKVALAILVPLPKISSEELLHQLGSQRLSSRHLLEAQAIDESLFKKLAIQQARQDPKSIIRFAQNHPLPDDEQFKSQLAAFLTNHPECKQMLIGYAHANPEALLIVVDRLNITDQPLLCLLAKEMINNESPTVREAVLPFLKFIDFENKLDLLERWASRTKQISLADLEQHFSELKPDERLMCYKFVASCPNIEISRTGQQNLWSDISMKHADKEPLHRLFRYFAFNGINVGDLGYPDKNGMLLKKFHDFKEYLLHSKSNGDEVLDLLAKLSAEDKDCQKKLDALLARVSADAQKSKIPQATIERLVATSREMDLPQKIQHAKWAASVLKLVEHFPRLNPVLDDPALIK